MAKNKRIAAVIGAGTALSAATYLITDYVMKFAMDRKRPRTPSVFRRDEDPYAMFNDAAAALKAAPHEDVETVSRDGIRLVGHWYENSEPKRIILAAHGWRSDWNRDFGYSYPFLRDHGCSILYIEQRAQGDSDGDYMGFGLVERYDILDWLEWIKKRCGEELPVYLAGISMGATTVLMASGLELPGNVKGIIADCGFTSPSDIWRHVARKTMHIPFLLTGLYSRMLCRKKIGMSSSYSTTDALKNNKLPVLFVHGQKDGFVPVEMTKKNYAACTSPKYIMIVPEADHGMSYYLAKEQYEQKEMEFWDKYDK